MPAFRAALIFLLLLAPAPAGATVGAACGGLAGACEADERCDIPSGRDEGTCVRSEGVPEAPPPEPEAPPAASTEETNTNVPFTPATPEPAVFIPGYTGFSTLQVEGSEGGGRYVDIPFLAEYIVVIYRYAIGIIVTLAMVMVVVGGLRWLTAAGNAERVGQAKNTITRALMGLLIALGSYTILYLINPELVNFRSIRVDIIQGVPLEPGEPEEVDEAAGTGAPSGPVSAGDPCRQSDPGIPFDTDTLVRVTVGDCLNVNMVNPALREELEAVGREFCRLRGGNRWRITGQAYRSSERSLQLYLTRCYGREHCTISTGCPLRSGILTRENGLVVTVDPALRDLSGSALYDALVPFVLGPRGGHSEGLALDVFCRAGGFRESTGSFHVACHLAMEQAFKNAGWCRIPNEAWHFEHPSSPRGLPSCRTSWTIGTYAIRGQSYDMRSCSGIFQQLQSGESRCRPL